MPADPTLDAKIAAVRSAVALAEAHVFYWREYPNSSAGTAAAAQLTAMRAILADLETSRPAPLPDGEPSRCPFCGCDETPVVTWRGPNLQGVDQCRAYCPDCDASGPLVEVTMAYGKYCEKEIENGEKAALTRWNARTRRIVGTRDDVRSGT